MEIKVIEKNKTNILSGLIVVPPVNCFPTSSRGDNPKERRNIAPTKATIQYVSMTMFLILIWGKNSMDNTINIEVVIAMIIVGIITIRNYYPSL